LRYSPLSTQKKENVEKESGAEEKGKDSAPFSLFHPNRSLVCILFNHGLSVFQNSMF
jgi:hypothetical protein